MKTIIVTALLLLTVQSALAREIIVKYRSDPVQVSTHFTGYIEKLVVR